MSNKRPLVPPFLNRFDHYLLTNKPEAWSARTHLVAYYGLLFIAVLAFLSFIIPNDPRSDSPAPYWVGFVVVISIIALVVWLIYLLRFNVFKRYGNITPLSRLATFGLYFGAVGIFALFPLVMPYVESFRANKAYGNREITDDINALNIKICQLEYDSLPHKLKADTIVVVNKLPQYRNLPAMDDDEMITVTPSRPYGRRMVDTGALAFEIRGADSSTRLNDSTWVLYNSKEYIFVRSYTANTYARHAIYSDYDLYQKVFRNYSPPNRQAVRTELYRLLDKYRLGLEKTQSYEYGDVEKDMHRKIIEKYDLYDVEHSIDNITERKYRWRRENTEWMIRLCYYAALIITLLVFIYRHSTRKIFFLSMLVAILLTILTSLIGAYFTPQESSIYLWLMAYTVLFFAVSLFSFRTRIRHVVTGIGINLFVLMVVSFPLCLVAYYYRNIVEKNRLLPEPQYVYIDEETRYRSILYAEIAGLLLLLILLAAYIPKVYRKWYALPEE